MLNELSMLLQQKNMRALSVFEKIKSSANKLLTDRLAPLEIALNNLNFSLAYQEVQSLLGVYNDY